MGRVHFFVVVRLKANLLPFRLAIGRSAFYARAHRVSGGQCRETLTSKGSDLNWVESKKHRLADMKPFRQPSNMLFG